MSDSDAVLSLEPEDLDGHTIEELSDYLDGGRQPGDPSIDNSPACQIALGALQRLKNVAGTYLDVDPGSAGTDEDWISAVLTAIPIDARAGRHFPWPSNTPTLAAHTTEGAIRGLVRAVGDDVPGLLVGSVRIEGDEPVVLKVDVALVFGTRLLEADAAFRRMLQRVLPDHLPFAIGAIDIRVVGLIENSAHRTASS